MSGQNDILKLIGQLQFIRDYECKTEDEVKAMCEAIRILSESPAQPQAKDVPDTNVWDTIYRQDAVNVAMQYCPDDDGTCSKSGNDLRELLDDLEALPPAQPQRSMNTIRRSDAIDALIKAYTYIDPMSFTDVIMGVEDARPQRMHGRWIVIPGMNEQCSECGKFFPLSYFKDRPFEINFCPNCGADMREESNGLD